MGVSFQKSHLNFCPKSRTPPFPQIDCPEEIAFNERIYDTRQIVITP
jgi:hypothetical protein